MNFKDFISVLLQHGWYYCYKTDGIISPMLQMKMQSIFTNRNIRIYTKINNLKAYIWSILLHGCECWTLTKVPKRRLEAAEMWYIRRIMRIWTEEKSKQEVMEMTGQRSLLKTIRKRQLQFFWAYKLSRWTRKANTCIEWNDL